jgi:hypothetical protein
MLISMPTGTSTIFGVFQAILALLIRPDAFRPQGQTTAETKVRQLNFRHTVPAMFCCSAKGNSPFVRLLSKMTRDQRVQVVRSALDGD